MLKAAEASGKTPEERRAERRQKAVVGPLPESFLRIPGYSISLVLKGVDICCRYR